jgi:hypothetical protein
MALSATVLLRAKPVTDPTRMTLTTATGIARRMLALVDDEMMLVTWVADSPTVQVVPGYQGTTAGPHGVGAPVIFGNPIDFVNVGGPQSMSFGADGAITGPGGAGTVPVSDMWIFLTKPTAGAYTIVSPALDQNNRITFISTTAAAHVITYTPGFFGNTTASDTATFVASVGSNFTVQATGGLWTPTAIGGVSVVIA